MRPLADLTSVWVVLPSAMAATSSLPVLTGIAREAAVGDAVFKQVGERAARLHDVFGQIVQLLVALVADDQSLVAVEHAQALRHVVDGDAHARVVQLACAG